MTTPDPTFNGISLSDYDFTLGPGSRLVYTYPVRSAKSSTVDGGVSSEGTMGPLRIAFAGTIVNSTSLSSVFSSFGEIMKLFRSTGVGSKRGQLDLFGDGKHWLAQIVGSPTFVALEGEAAAQVAFEFLADDPFRRSELIEISGTPANTLTATYVTDFSGDAPRMPCVVNLGSGWSAGEVVQIYNTTSGDRFGYVVSSSITSSEELVINGETFQVLEGTRIAGGHVSGVFPYVLGGDDNVFDFTGSDRLVATTIEFWDRYWT